MKLDRTNIDENYLSSDVVSISLGSLACLGLPWLISWIRHLNPFVFFFQCRKQAEVTGAKSGDSVSVICGACHVLRANLLKPDLCELSNSRDELQIVSNVAPFFEERSFVQVEWIDEYVCQKIITVHFGIILESVDNIETARILYDYRHQFLLWISILSFMRT
jgi:hypothetical protein